MTGANGCRTRGEAGPAMPSGDPFPPRMEWRTGREWERLAHCRGERVVVREGIAGPASPRVRHSRRAFTNNPRPGAVSATEWLAR